MVLDLRCRLRELFDALLLVKIFVIWRLARGARVRHRFRLLLALPDLVEEKAQASTLSVFLSRALLSALLALFHETVAFTH